MQSMQKVHVKWCNRWYPATLIEVFDHSFAHVEFDNPDYPPEDVPLADVRPIVEINQEMQSMQKVQVKWGKKWYPAFFIGVRDNLAHVGFDDVHYQPAAVPLADVRPIVEKGNPFEKSKIDVVLPVDAKVPAGVLQKDVFRKYVEYIVNDGTKTILSFEDVSLIRNAVKLSKHAAERRDERYLDTIQEFQRSMSTTQDCLYVIDTRYVVYFTIDTPPAASLESSVACMNISKSVRYEVDQDSNLYEVEVTLTSSLSSIVKIESDPRKFLKRLKRAEACPSLESEIGLDFAALVDKFATAAKKIGPEASFLSTLTANTTVAATSTTTCSTNLGHYTKPPVYEDCSNLSHASDSIFQDAIRRNCYEASVVHVHTTTSTLIFSKDLLRLITCYPNRIGFRDWKSSIYKRDQSSNQTQNRNQRDQSSNQTQNRNQRDQNRKVAIKTAKLAETVDEKRIRKINKERRKGKKTLDEKRTRTGSLEVLRAVTATTKSSKINKERQGKGKKTLDDNRNGNGTGTGRSSKSSNSNNKSSKIHKERKGKGKNTGTGTGTGRSSKSSNSNNKSSKIHKEREGKGKSAGRYW